MRDCHHQKATPPIDTSTTSRSSRPRQLRRKRRRLPSLGGGAIGGGTSAEVVGSEDGVGPLPEGSGLFIYPPPAWVRANTAASHDTRFDLLRILILLPKLAVKSR